MSVRDAAIVGLWVIHLCMIIVLCGALSKLAQRVEDIADRINVDGPPAPYVAVPIEDADRGIYLGE